MPAAGEPVVGVIVEKHGEAFTVEINGPCAAALPVLAFESATVRCQPEHLQQLGFRNRLADTHLVCTSITANVPGRQGGCR